MAKKTKRISVKDREKMKKDPQFQNALNELSDAWITQNKLDKNLFEKFKKI